MQHQPFVHPITPRKTDPVPTSSTAPTPQSNSILTYPLQSNLVQQHPGYIRVVLRRLYLRRKQLQLPALSLFIENFDRLEPTGSGVAIELAQITKRALSRTVRRTDGFDQ